MTFEAFNKFFRQFGIFSIQDIRVFDSQFHLRQLRFWQASGKIKQVSRGFYMMGDQEIDDQLLWLSANTLYQPSYISLELGLSYYGLIPESVYSITSVTTKKTQRITASIGTFVYQHLKPSLYFGIKHIVYDKRSIMIATPEKVILDYLYLHPEMDDVAQVESMRFNAEKISSLIHSETFALYLERFESKSLNHRVKQLVKGVKND